MQTSNTLNVLVSVTPSNKAQVGAQMTLADMLCGVPAASTSYNKKTQKKKGTKTEPIIRWLDR